MSTNVTEPVNLLWTGGWDSTYRLLDVVLRHRHPVQPWYVVDRERASTPVEEAVMATIREAVMARDAAAAYRILPTRRFSLADVAPDPIIDALHRTTALGGQYGWLARFAEQVGVHDFEMGSVQVLGGTLCTLLGPNIERVIGKAGATYRVVEHPVDDAAALFRRFEFPIIHLTKEEIRHRAERDGFLDLMRLTWTCHTPKGGKPCGMCTPCRVMMRSGQRWRIPPLRRVRPLLRIAKAKARDRLRPSTFSAA